jgi:hypothetical protein
MFGRRYRADETYLRSQAATTLPFRATSVVRGLALRVAAAPDDHRERRRLAQLLIDELDATAGLTRCQVTVADRPQVHEHDGQRLQSKTYGYYNCAFNGSEVSNARIRIYHRTAVRQQVISPKVFLNTVLHEWMHHYDFAGLRLSRSPHTAGFYTRLRALADALDVSFVLPPEPEPSTALAGVRSIAAGLSGGGAAS